MSNKNEHATVILNFKFLELNTRSAEAELQRPFFKKAAGIEDAQRLGSRNGAAQRGGYE